MSDATFVLGMAAIIAFAIGIPAYVRYKDARDDARRWREFTERPLSCFRQGCHSAAVRGGIYCPDCIKDLKRRGISV